MVWSFSSCVVQQFGMIRTEVDPSVSYRHSSHGKHIFLIVYVDDIAITRDDYEGIAQLKQHLSSHFRLRIWASLNTFWALKWHNQAMVLLLFKGNMP